MKKQFFRVKQLADQTFSRAEKTDVLTENLVIAEKRVELLRQSCQNTTKRISACLQGIGLDHALFEKRQKKMPLVQLSQSMLEASNALGESSAMGNILNEGSKLEGSLGRELFNFELDVERSVLGPLQSVLDNDIPNIAKLRKQLSKLTLDMDSARTRYLTANRHSQMSMSSNLNSNKADVIREELEDASMRVEQCRDALASEMFALLSREAELTEYILHLFQFQAAYHRSSLQALENAIPLINDKIENFQLKPVFGTPLEEHLRLNDRKIASVIEQCILCLWKYGLEEEGLFRIAGSVSKVKKLKAGFDAGVVDMTEFDNDPHTVAGALKSYLRELPEPLMTHSLYSDWMKACKIGDADKRLQELWQVVQQLPDPNYNNLRYLIKFLHQLTLHSDVNKMSSQNIAIVIPPNIIWAPNEDQNNIGINMSLASTHSSIVDSLVMYADWFFPGDIDFGAESISDKKDDSPDSSSIETEEAGESHESLSEIATKAETEEQSFESQGAHDKQPNEGSKSPQNSEAGVEKNTLLMSAISTTVTSSSFESTTVSQSQKAVLTQSPRVPKRTNKKSAAPPIPNDSPKNNLLKSSSLDRSLSSRPLNGKPVLIERAKSYIEKSIKPPIIRKTESQYSSHHEKSEFSSSEELLTDIGRSSPNTLERICHKTMSVSSDESFQSFDELSCSRSFNGGDGSPLNSSNERKSLVERPTDKPPLPPERSSARGSSNQEPESISSEVNNVLLKSVENLVMNQKTDTNLMSVDVAPERPPRSHSPSTNVMNDKAFCTIIKVQGQDEAVSNPTVKVKPAKPPLPACIKSRTSSSNENTHL